MGCEELPALCVTGGESTLAGNEVMNRLKEIPTKWKESLSSSSFERHVCPLCQWFISGANPLNK
jgi:hypothetical protein